MIDKEDKENDERWLDWFQDPNRYKSKCAMMEQEEGGEGMLKNKIQDGVKLTHERWMADIDWNKDPQWYLHLIMTDTLMKGINEYGSTWNLFINKTGPFSYSKRINLEKGTVLFEDGSYLTPDALRHYEPILKEIGENGNRLC